MQMFLNVFPKILFAVLSCAAMSFGEIGAAEPTSLKVSEGASRATISAGDRTVVDYRTTASPLKPYVRELFTPGGVQILRDSPEDHKHHHGLMFAVSADGVDFWSETPGCGKQAPRPQAEAKSSAGTSGSQAAFTQLLDWTSPTGAKLLGEQRTITAHVGAEIPATLLTWRSQLSTPEGKASVKVTGSHYFGLGMRFVESMDKAGRFFNSDGREGTVVRGSERVTPARWCAYTSSVDGKPVTVAMFDHPKNARPAQFFTMRPFAYLSATINLWKEPLEVKAGSPLDLSYGIAVWDGEIEASQVESLYRKWSEIVR